MGGFATWHVQRSHGIPPLHTHLGGGVRVCVSVPRYGFQSCSSCEVQQSHIPTATANHKFRVQPCRRGCPKVSHFFLHAKEHSSLQESLAVNLSLDSDAGSFQASPPAVTEHGPNQSSGSRREATRLVSTRVPRNRAVSRIHREGSGTTHGPQWPEEATRILQACLAAGGQGPSMEVAWPK